MKTNFFIAMYMSFKAMNCDPRVHTACMIRQLPGLRGKARWVLGSSRPCLPRRRGNSCPQGLCLRPVRAIGGSRLPDAVHCGVLGELRSTLGCRGMLLVARKPRTPALLRERFFAPSLQYSPSSPRLGMCGCNAGGRGHW